jgi:hypothetical protein
MILPSHRPMPRFLIRSNGREVAAKKQLHNEAWWQAKQESFDGPTGLVRVVAGKRTDIAWFNDGVPYQEKTPQ